jgi:hypothetical protein
MIRQEALKVSDRILNLLPEHGVTVSVSPVPTGIDLCPDQFPLSAPLPF